MDSFKKTEVEFWGFVDFSWIFRGFVGGFFVDFSWIHLKPCGFFMDSWGGFTLDLGWIYLDLGWIPWIFFVEEMGDSVQDFR